MSWIRIAFVGSALLTLIPLWSVRFPPMVDVPQHAAQVRLWIEFDQLDADRYELNLLTPYLGFYLITRVLATFLPLLIAFKVLISITMLALPTWMWWELHRRSVDPWFALLGFPAAYSFCFYWGLLNFMVATPIACWFLSEVTRSERLQRRSLIRQAGLAVVLFFAHGLVCAFTLGVAALLVLARSRSMREVVMRSTPSLIPAGLGFAWLASVRGSPQVSQGASWNWSSARLAALPAELLGSPLDPWALLIGASFLGLTAILLVHRGAIWIHFIPLAATLVVYLLGPEIFFHAAFFNSRFASLVIPFAALAMTRPSISLWARASVVALAVGWLVHLPLRFEDFDFEAREFVQILEDMEPGKRALGLVSEPFPTGLDFPVFLHFHAWYAARGQASEADFSFAYFYPQLIRYRLERVQTVADHFVWTPQLYDPTLHDHELIITKSSKAPVLPAGALTPIARSGSWRLFERTDSASRGSPTL